MSQWIAHVKQTQAQYNCSYKEALQLASRTWTKVTSGSGLGSSKVKRVKKDKEFAGVAEIVDHKLIEKAYMKMGDEPEAIASVLGYSIKAVKKVIKQIKDRVGQYEILQAIQDINIPGVVPSSSSSSSSHPR
jgi:aspartate ammonia-lyase